MVSTASATAALGSAAVPRRLESLTGLRLFAAAGVVVAHLGLTVGGRVGQHSRSLSSLGWLGVSFFFVLSGFLLTWQARPGDRARSFYRRRFARIYPAYLVSLIASILVGHFVEHTTLDRRGLLATVLLVQAWIPHLRYFFAINAVAWSLSVEAFFYALWPFVVPAILRLRRRSRLWLAGGLMAVVTAIGCYATVAVPGDPAVTINVDRHWQLWLVYICPAARLPEFLIGAILASLVREGWRPRWTMTRALILLAVVFAVIQVHHMPADLVAVPLLALVSLVLAAALTDLGGRRSWLRGRRMVWLGAASYCIYLVHELPLRVFLHHDPVPTGGHAVAYLLVVPVAGLALAALLHTFVEIPAESRLRGRRKAPAPGTTDGVDHLSLR